MDRPRILLIIGDQILLAMVLKDELQDGGYRVFDSRFRTAGVGWKPALAPCGSRFNLSLRQWMEAMSDAVGPGDLVLCVNVAPNHVTGRPVPLVAGETYRVVAVMEFACPCGRSDALLDVGVDFAWCQTRFRLLPKPKAQSKTRRVSAPREKETVR